MSSHADTIRRALTKVVQDTYLTDYHDDAQAAYDAYDALLAEIEEWRVLGARQLEEFTVTTQKYRAENQRLREALRAVLEAHSGDAHQIAREALAGDEE